MSETIGRFISRLPAIVLAIPLSVGLAWAASAEPSLAEDLFAVITLQGKPCEQVLEHTKLGADDYNVTCKSGDRYRVRITDEQVVVEKR